MAELACGGQAASSGRNSKWPVHMTIMYPASHLYCSTLSDGYSSRKEPRDILINFIICTDDNSSVLVLYSIGGIYGPPD
jgi:hypothetical protein